MGRQTALALLHHGCTKFILTDSSATRLDYTSLSLKSQVERLGVYTTILLLPGDLREHAFVDHVFAEITRRFGRVDYAINCLDVHAPHPSTGTTTGKTTGAGASFQGVTVMNGLVGAKGSNASVGDSSDIGNGEFDLASSAAKGEGSKAGWTAAAEGLKALWEVTRREIGMMSRQQVRLRQGYEARKQRGAIVNLVVGRQDSRESWAAPLIWTLECAQLLADKQRSMGLSRIRSRISRDKTPRTIRWRCCGSTRSSLVRSSTRICRLTYEGRRGRPVVG